MLLTQRNARISNRHDGSQKKLLITPILTSSVIECADESSSVNNRSAAARKIVFVVQQNRAVDK